MATSELVANLLGGAVVTTALVIAGAGYTVLAWQCRRRWGTGAFVLLWMAAILGSAWLGSSRACEVGACDVGGVHYRSRAARFYGLVAAMGLAPAAIAIGRLARTQAPPRLGWRWPLLGGAGLVAGMLIVMLAYSAVARWTCDSRSMRRADGSVGTACEKYQAEQPLSS
jgi:hypothetical protein